MKPFVIPAPVKKRKPRGSGGTPDVDRQAASRQSLAMQGGKLVQVRLPAEAVADLTSIQARDGVSVKDAVIRALRTEAGRR